MKTIKREGWMDQRVILMKESVACISSRVTDTVISSFRLFTFGYISDSS